MSTIVLPGKIIKNNDTTITLHHKTKPNIIADIGI